MAVVRSPSLTFPARRAELRLIFRDVNDDTAGADANFDVAADQAARPAVGEFVAELKRLHVVFAGFSRPEFARGLWQCALIRRVARQFLLDLQREFIDRARISGSKLEDNAFHILAASATQMGLISCTKARLVFLVSLAVRAFLLQRAVHVGSEVLHLMVKLPK